MVRLLSTTAALLGFLATTQASPSFAKRHRDRQHLVGSLPSKASDLEYRYQPVLDFDHDGCYQASAIDAEGHVSPGLRPTGPRSGSCRTFDVLRDSNTYSRARCNGDICGIVYAYYFHKDQTTLFGCPDCGHRHDWEHVIVVIRRSTGQILRVAATHHYAYWIKDADFHVENGTHPMVNYHKDGVLTHALRLAADPDINNVQNYYKHYYKAPLVGWHGFPSHGVREVLNWYDFGSASLKTSDKDNWFAQILRGVGADDDFGLDVSQDDWNTMTPEMARESERIG